ncbi:hypothetical protein Pcinc_010795 [Petrolisthes cinctipes]|uniref:Uncharacterized protein n=1 Tax=Petrolisthes cinctipes TaxID=88211 RepID=A0AAE1G2C9_PETCI|nr:hypothetical protein Pcinc_010795 [Petrolisthes cinctipes]
MNVKDVDLEYLGTVTAIGDTVVTDYGIANPDYNMIDTDKNIVSFSDTTADSCTKIDSLLIRPSDVIERINRRSVSDLKCHYTKLINNRTSVEAFRKALSSSLRTASTVGIKIRMDMDDSKKTYTFYNKKASMGFNIFNSHPLAVEAHTDADVMLLMTIFLKHNSLWHNSLPLNYSLLDYVKTFFRREDKTDTPFFAHELASCIPTTDALAESDYTSGRKRKAAAPPAPALNMLAADNLVRATTSGHCRHDFESS